ncbi:hypothetical protein [Glaciihabitans sp. dw_435]|uniref:hypothetical protein n=1 Tax=Glaciihabitans sp. dw_435 TaxID=2720081 RepID=UPI001BD569B3|nr:hypothetical protein [Glaciihabitans sp. dw_435]
MSFRRAGRVAGDFAVDSAGYRWWLLHPALPAPRLVESAGDTVIHARDERDEFRALDRAAQHDLLDRLWTRVVDWAGTQGLSGASAEAMDTPGFARLTQLGFDLRDVRTYPDGPSFRAGSRMVDGDATSAALRGAFDIDAVYLCAFSATRDLVVVYDSTWDAILVSAVAAPTELL